VVFPRAGAYRVWVQFQSAGVINTARFDVPVARLLKILPISPSYGRA